MEDRLKERLTGAVLLVVLVVVLVPAIFRGEQTGAAGATSNAGAQQQVYTIDLKGATAPALAADSLVGDSAAATVPSGEPPSSAAADVPADSGAPPAPPADERSASVGVVTAPVAAKPASVAAKPAPATRPSVVAKASPVVPKASPAAPKGSFVVQVGSFSKRDNAQQMVKQAARKGVHLVVAGPDDRGNFRVRTVAVHTRQEAVALQEHLRGQGFKGLVGAAN